MRYISFSASGRISSTFAKGLCQAFPSCEHPVSVEAVQRYLLPVSGISSIASSRARLATILALAHKTTYHNFHSNPIASLARNHQFPKQYAMAQLPMRELPRISLHSPSLEDLSRLRPATPNYNQTHQDQILDPNAVPPGSSP